MFDLNLVKNDFFYQTGGSIYANCKVLYITTHIMLIMLAVINFLNT
jgi:hypothetical protein